MKKNKQNVQMAEISISPMDKPIVVIKAFTLLEMLMVLVVVSILLIISAYPMKQKASSSKYFFYQLQTIIETARLEALANHETVSVEFKSDRICVAKECYFTDLELDIRNKQNVSFNQNGHILKGTHIDFSINQQSYRLIFNVGQGAYRIEKN